ncbi:MAG: hypothetical protein IPK52_27250 [Chloroflexi bacterium]|nr:hypothetical protein [Chloroflexota bacterium]
MFQRFARQVGEQLAKRHDDDQYCDQGVIVDGLANFLKIVCELTVKRLNGEVQGENLTADRVAHTPSALKAVRRSASNTPAFWSYALSR